MKKGLIVLGLALVVGLFSTFTYADGSLDGKDLYGDSMNEDSRPWGEDIVKYEENAIKMAGERNRLIQEQAKTGNGKYNYKWSHCRNRSRLNS